jgi:hypothetical protein
MGPELGKGQGISEKLLADNFRNKEKNRWPRPRLSEKVWIGKDRSAKRRNFSRTPSKKSCKKSSRQKWMKRLGREKESGPVNGMDTAASITSGE